MALVTTNTSGNTGADVARDAAVHCCVLTRSMQYHTFDKRMSTALHALPVERQCSGDRSHLRGQWITPEGGGITSERVVSGLVHTWKGAGGLGSHLRGGGMDHT